MGMNTRPIIHAPAYNGGFAPSPRAPPMQSLWMLLACLMFAIMGACVKVASEHQVSLAQIVLFRGLPSVLLILVWARLTRRSLHPKRWQAHVLRNCFGLASMWMGFYALSHLPLSTAISLGYTSPLFIAGWMLIRGGGQRDPVRLITVALGFAGVVAVLRPTISADQWLPALLGSLAGATSAVAVLQIRSLTQLGEPEWRTVFLFSCFVCLSSLAGLGAEGWPSVQPSGWLVLTMLGVSGLFGQLAMTRAFGLGSTLLSAVLQYATIIFGSLLGFVVWGDVPGLVALGGIACIISAGLLSIWRTYTEDRTLRGLTRHKAATAATTATTTVTTATTNTSTRPNTPASATTPPAEASHG